MEGMWKQVDNFAGKTHKIIESDVLISLDRNDLDCVDSNNKVFSFSELGGDDYYPSGGYSIQEGVFEPIKTLPLEKRPVHIFKGDSNSCKSYLASLTGKAVFETDSVKSFDELPKVLTQDIIVVGNRWECDIEELKKLVFGDSEIITVTFSK